MKIPIYEGFVEKGLNSGYFDIFRWAEDVPQKYSSKVAVDQNSNQL